MIYGKLWCVVKPSTGIPLLLGAVAVSSFLVHYALLTHTSWLVKYYNGSAAVTAAADNSTTVTAAAPPAALAPPAAKN